MRLLKIGFCRMKKTVSSKACYWRKKGVSIPPGFSSNKRFGKFGATFRCSQICQTSSFSGLCVSSEAGGESLGLWAHARIGKQLKQR
ncbi:MAG: hypothetical protein WC299_04970 [Kiritimatiellia bacterium]